MSGEGERAHVSHVRDLFDDWARRGRGDDMAQRHAPFARHGFERLPLSRDGWYLDVGCGVGYTVRWAAEAAPRGRAVGLDASAEMISRAHRLTADLPTVEFHVASFPKHLLPPGRFDAVFSMEVLYYLPDLERALAEVSRLLRPGGRFACMVDYYDENVASHSWPEDVGVSMRLLNAAGWRRAIGDAGLRVLEQDRVRVPRHTASAPWQVTEGSLFTLAERPTAGHPSP